MVDAFGNLTSTLVHFYLSTFGPVPGSGTGLMLDHNKQVPNYKRFLPTYRSQESSLKNEIVKTLHTSKSNLLYSLFYVEACNEFAVPAGNTAPFEERLQRQRAVGNIKYDLTDPRFEPHTYRSKDERVTARPTGRILRITVFIAVLFKSFIYRSKDKLYCIVLQTMQCIVIRYLFIKLRWPEDSEGPSRFLESSCHLFTTRSKSFALSRLIPERHEQRNCE